MNIDGNRAYRYLGQQAKKYGLFLENSRDPVFRIHELARLVAQLRLNEKGGELEWTYVRVIVIAYLSKVKEENLSSLSNEEEHLNFILERFIAEHAVKIISQLENQPYYSCKVAALRESFKKPDQKQKKEC